MLIVMMMAGARQMVYLVGYVECASLRIPAALHGEAMQGQKEHQENANEAAHGKLYWVKSGQIIPIRFCLPAAASLNRKLATTMITHL